jgi:Cdc25 family phosphatase
MKIQKILLPVVIIIGARGTPFAQYTTLTAQELAEVYQNEGVEVVDVRGTDFQGGHIPGCQHIKASEIREEPELFLDGVIERQMTHVIFTCMYSAVRAPQCANAVSEAAKAYANPPRFSILSKGIHGWVNTFVNDRDKFGTFVKDFDSDLWMDAENDLSEGGLVHVMDVIWSKKGQAIVASVLEKLLRKSELDQPPNPPPSKKSRRAI